MMLSKKRKKINEINVRKKRVLVRCDFNISLEDEREIFNSLRIQQTIPTINYLLKNNAKVILLSHLSGEKSILPVKNALSFFLQKEVKFVSDCVGKNVKKEIAEMREGDVLLLENVRKYKEEKENSSRFGKELASLADIFINDAFSVSHRNHASLAKTPLFLPSAMGMLMEREIKVLEKLKRNPKKPVVAVIGGAKVESKISVVNYFLENADHVLLGGKIANMVLIVRKIAFNLPWPSKEIEQFVEKIDYTSPKLHIPVDVIASKDNTGEKGVRETAPAKINKNEDIFDIGKETIKLYGDIISEAKTVIWAGPLGFSERKAFERGTKEVGRHVVENEEAVKVIGGGDTGKAFQQFGLLNKMDLVSYGGGAMLAYISGEPMPGIEALTK